MSNYRQDELYAFLASREDWTPMRDVAGNLRAIYGWGWGSSGFHNSGIRRMITEDIERINQSDEYDMIIISGSRGIKLASRGEFARWATAEYAEIFRKLKRVRHLTNKAGMHGQMRLLEEETFRDVFPEESA